MNWQTDAAVQTPPRAMKAVSASTLGDLESSGEIPMLVLDDESATCALIQAALSAKDFVIDTVADPARVEETLKQKDRYKLIILDYVLPGLEADQVFGWIRDYQADASIIVVTGYPSVDSALSCLRARTYDYVTKPFQIDQLREIVLRCLESKGLLRITEDALKKALGLAIRDRRQALNLTLQQMSAKTKVSLGYLSQIELGKNSASIETLYKISLALGVKLSDLFASVQKG